MKEIDKVTRKRLVYVKKLHIHAQEHLAHDTEFDQMLAILHLDNVVEILLKCVAAAYGISLGDPIKLRYDVLWGKVDEEYKRRTGSELPLKAQMFRMHRVRGDVQHWGASPFSLEFVKDLAVFISDFFQTILRSVFDLPYNELFTSSLVNDVEIRELLKEAEEFFSDEKWKEAIAKISVAFALARIKALRRRHLPSKPRTLSQLGLVSEDADERLSILALGLDIEDYKRFAENTPAVPFVSLGEEGIQWIRELDLSKENTLFCLNFALDAVVRWSL
jgi:hypothetical protein